MTPPAALVPAAAAPAPAVGAPALPSPLALLAALPLVLPDPAAVEASDLALRQECLALYHALPPRLALVYLRTLTAP